jgi:2,4-dienoyl-CoA reductase-like NADH-dependent reductase (Old Yellow Enzyme family)
MPNVSNELIIRDVTLRNRIVVSPMCEYSSTDGFVNDWHLVHLGSRAVGGAALVFTEATAVTPEGRISPQDLGIWKDEHIEPLARITRFIREQGAVPGMQLAHAGRKGSTRAPWEKPGEVPVSEGGWVPVAPSALRFDPTYPMPRELRAQEIRDVVAAFRAAAKRALAAGFMVLEIHSAHGYLLHEFLSPVSNNRFDAYGGSFENRTRLLCEVITAVREVWPENYPVFVRISATDWIRGDAWDVEQTVALAEKIGPLGVDLMDCSSGGIAPGAKIPVGPGYQVPLAERVKRETGILTGAVGMITQPAQANEIISDEKADLIIVAREFLRHPYWPLQVAKELGFPAPWPVQYLRAAADGSPRRQPVVAPEPKRRVSAKSGG